MKILLDCVVTAEPAKCSSTVQFVTFVTRTLEKREDVFFYWLIPDWVTKEEFEACYPQHPRVRYIPVPQHKDRTKEYLTFGKHLDQAVAFNGSCWDYDVLVTVRAGLVPLMKLVMNSPRHASMPWLKQVWLIEEMPLMDFKKTVMTINADVQDLYTISGYLAADRVFILSYHEKPMIVKRAREFLTPSHVISLEKKIQPTVTSQFYEFRLKPPEEWFVPGGGKPFCIAYAGRMEMSSRIDEINDLMTKQFVMKGDKVRLLATTQSRVIKKFDTSLIDVRMAGREEFWQLAKHDMHVLLKLEIEGGFNLSLLEPMMFGVPAIINRAEWSEALLGKDYPFMVKSETQAYALVSEFYRDYASMYARFAAWHEQVFQPLFLARFKTDLLYDLLDAEVGAFGKTYSDFAKKHPGKKANGFVADLLKEVGDAGELVIGDVVESMVKKGLVDKKMADKLREEDRDERGLVWSTGWNEYRVILKSFYGWEDASTAVGHLRRAA